MDCPPGLYGTLVVDEAHRLNRFSGLYGNQGENQVKEIINASHARWNLAAEGNTWIISPTGVEEVGCVHTCQVLEVDTIGEIIGPDLVFRDGQLQANPTARARSDKSLTGWRAAMATDPKGTEERVSRLIRNT